MFGKMKLTLALIVVSLGLAQAPPPVEIELMTYPEIAAAIRQGKTTVLVYNGGTEQRGPHAVLGGHTLIAHATAAAIARRLGNALVAPVLPFSPTDGHLKAKFPGTVSVPMDVFLRTNEAVVASMVVNGFKHIVLMGDHGGGQKELDELAKTLDAKYQPKGVRVHFCAIYAKSQEVIGAWIKQNNLPPSEHAGIPDTSSLMYLGGDAYVRRDKIVAGDPVLAPGQKRDPNVLRVDNGVQGDPRPSTPEMGKRFIDMKVSVAAEEIARMVR